MRTIWTIAILIGFPVSALAVELDVEVLPTRVVLGEDDAVRVTVRTAPNVDPNSLVLRSTGGSLSALEATAPGVFQAVLSPPSKRFPQLAVVTAAILGASAEEPPTIGQAVVSYAARVTLNGKSEPGARMQVLVGGRTHPEVLVANDGTFSVPVEVRPGEQCGTGIARDRFGNRSSTRINLYLPEVRRAHAFVQPQPVRIDADAWLFVTTVSSAGAPEAQPGISASARRGRLSDGVTVAPGITRYRYHAPRVLEDRVDLVELRHRSRSEPMMLPVALAPGPLARLEARGTRVSWDTAATVSVTGRDRFSNPVPLTQVVLVDRESAQQVVGTTVPPPGVEGPRSFLVRGSDGDGNEASGNLTVTWHRPLTLLITLRWADDGTLRVGHEDPAVLQRLELVALDAKLGEQRLVEGALEVEVQELGEKARIVARDPKTGTSVWIAAP